MLTVIPTDKMGPIRSWGMTTNNDCLPDSFVSGKDSATLVGGEAIDHDDTANIPYIGALPLLCPTLSPMVVKTTTKIGQPLARMNLVLSGSMMKERGV